MNSKSAKLLRKFSLFKNKNFRQLKKFYLTLNQNERFEAKNYYYNQVMFGGGLEKTLQR